MDFSAIDLDSYPHKYISPNHILKYHKMLNPDEMNGQQFMMLLKKHILTEEQMRCQGFPIWHKDNYATFFNTRKGRRHSPREWKNVLRRFYSNPNPYFHNEDIEYVSVASSSSSSSSITDDEDSGHASSGITSQADVDKSPAQSKKQPAFKKDCTRCNKLFYLNANTGDYIFEEECHYHWGKIIRNGYTGSWECCGAQEYTRGCTVARQHVWSGMRPGHNGPFYDYAKTTSPQDWERKMNQRVYALDCEMVFTKNGMEVAKVSIVNLYGQLVFSTLIKPSTPIVDYNTRFSGLRPSDLADVTEPLSVAREVILGFVNSETILIGHSLESDLRALKIVHMKVIDTSIMYPHCMGPPLRRSLKDLVRTELNVVIQDGEHNSVQDASAVINLVIHKMQEDIACMHRFKSPGCVM